MPIKKAEAPDPVIKNGNVSPEAAAYTAVWKFVVGASIYRQEQEWTRCGVKLSRQTMRD
jgi:hypothetical protein